jgi:hypothetical protein
MNVSKLSVPATVEGFYRIFGSMKRLQAIVIESEVVTELEALALGHECLLKDAKPSSSQVRQVIK